MKRLLILLLTMTITCMTFLCSCAGKPEAARTWRGEVPENGGIWTLTVLEDHRAQFSWNYLPQAVLTGEAFLDTDGSWLFHIDDVEWFENWVRGWTEAVFSAHGSLRLIPSAVGWTLEVSETPAIQSVRWAQIRHWDDGYYGDRARELTDRRWSRSRAVANYFRTTGDEEKLLRQKKFLNIYRSALLPEAYDRKHDVVKNMGDAGVWSEGIVWNTSYTRESFPEDLHAVRDSGTLYRDSQESPALVYLAYIWPDIWDSHIPPSMIEERTK